MLLLRLALASAIVFAMGWVLGEYGFVSGQATQPESALNAIIGIFTLGVIGLGLGGVYYTYQMKLDRKNHAILLQEIARIKAGGRIADAPAEARAVARLDHASLASHGPITRRLASAVLDIEIPDEGGEGACCRPLVAPGTARVRPASSRLTGFRPGRPPAPRRGGAARWCRTGRARWPPCSACRRW